MKVATGIDLTEQKANPENAIDFRWSDIRREDEKANAKANMIESLQKQADEENFPKRVTGDLFDYYGIAHWEKKTNKIRRSSLH